VSGYEFKIKVSSNGVEGEYDAPGQQEQTYKSKEINQSDLALDTVELLEQWLNRWEWIARADQTKPGRLLVPDTFRVLGTHLWSLILDNRVGEALREAYEADRDRQPLKVLIRFVDAERLAGLPWEFLYCPGSPGRRGFYLAAETSLVLSRYLALEIGRKPIRTADETIHALFINTLPDRPDFTDERENFNEIMDELKNIGPVLSTEVIDGWHPDKVAEQLERNTEIVHLVGVCKGDAKSQKLLLMEGDDPWCDAEPVVTVLTRNQDNLPQLVVLHLCEWQEGDATENFERLAPSLVKAGVPAVLAMQYPMAPDYAGTFVKQFYERLANGQDIGQAVQAARQENLSDGLNRRFGTPVLYMQSVDGVLLTTRAKGASSGSMTVNEPAVAVSDIGASDIREKLLELIEFNSPDAEAVRYLEEWVKSTAWPSDPDKAWAIIRSRFRDEVDNPDLRPVYAKLAREVRGMKRSA
jgi:hypothetical protein